jgi:hypothetical protein
LPDDNCTVFVADIKSNMLDVLQRRGWAVIEKRETNRGWPTGVVVVEREGILHVESLRDFFIYLATYGGYFQVHFLPMTIPSDQCTF